MCLKRLVIAMLVLLCGCSAANGSPSVNAKDARVCQMVLSGGTPNRPAWRAAADPGTKIGKAAIAASYATGLTSAYNLDAKLSTACIEAGF